MKTNLLLFLLFCSLITKAQTNVQYTLIPDAKFEAHLIAMKVDDVADGKVITSKINTVTSLNLSNSSISNLTGIEDFTALTTLECKSSNLTALDVSKNINLTTLNCANNKLTNLDVSKNLNLAILICNGNYFSSIDITKNTALHTLKISHLKDNVFSSAVAEGKIETLDLSNNLALLNLDCSGHNLKSLDITKNILLKNLTCTATNLSTINFSKNINLESLILTYRINFGGLPGNFESIDLSNNTKLVTLSIAQNKFSQIDLSKNTKLENLNISNNKFTQLDLSNNLLLTNLNISENQIPSLDLSNKTKLSVFLCNKNNFTSLDVSNNLELYNLECTANQLTTLNLTKNLKLNYLQCGSNKLTSLDVTQNKFLVDLYCQSNQISTLDISNTVTLQRLACDINNISELDVTKQPNLQTFDFAENKIKTIDVTQNKKLEYLRFSGNQISTIDISKNTALLQLNISKNKFTTIDLINNLKLESVICSDNLLTSLDISNNKNIFYVICKNNKLTNLNLKNGANMVASTDLDNYKNNPDLRCIQVSSLNSVNNSVSNQIKDATARYSEDCSGPITLPSNNFTVETKGESCLGENNGEINISAKEVFSYTANIGNKDYSFVNNKLAVSKLSPGNYTVTITIPGENFVQTFNLTIAKGATITGKSSISSKQVNVEIIDGTAPYTVFVNGIEQFESQSSNFSLTAKSGGLLEVKTAKACEGIYTEDITSLDLVVSSYPNPTSGSFVIELPGADKEVTIEINSLDGRLISNKKYTLENGTAHLTLEKEPKGVYLAKIHLSTVKTVKIIKN